MRNGLNISGVSELVHEIQTVPGEALIRFRTSGELDGGRVAVDVLTGRHGSIRMARGFGLRIEPLRPGATDELTAYESTVAAVGACVLITHVHGYSARGVSLSELGVRVSAEVDTGPGGARRDAPTALRNLRYRVDVSCDGDREQMATVSQFVTCFSPNHRAVLDAAECELVGVVHRSDGRTETVPVEPGDPIGDSAAAGAGGEPVTVEATLRWEYGTECEASTRVVGGAVGDTRPQWRSRFTVDQPKQMIGIDKGPNPQEVLLAAVSADLTHGVAAAAAAAGMPLAGVHTNGSGQLDIRGMMNISREAPARFHAVRFEIEVRTDAPLEQVADVLARAARDSAPLALVRDANQVAVELFADGEPVTAFTSSLAQATAFLAELARQQEAARTEAARQEAELAAQSGAPAAPVPV